MCVLKPEHGLEEKPVSLQIDTAAQVSVMSLNFLNKHFKCLKLSTPENKVTLLTADNRSILIAGTHNFEVLIGAKSEIIQFCIIKQGQTCLLGLPDIMKLGLKIDFGLLHEVMNHTNDKNSIMQISSEDDLQIFEIGAAWKASNNKRGAPKIMFFTPQHKVEVPQQKYISLYLICNDAEIQEWLYSRCLIWDCNCIVNVDDAECNTCLLTTLILSGLITPQCTIIILYSSNYACVLETNVDRFTALVNPSCDRFNRDMKTKQINAITVEAPGFVLSNDEMYFDPGQTDYKFSALNQVGPIDEGSFLKFEAYDLTNLCPICEVNGQKVFCDLNNEHCESLLNVKQKAG